MMHDLEAARVQGYDGLQALGGRAPKSDPSQAFQALVSTPSDQRLVRD